MSDRVDATITIGGRVPADRLDDLLDVIEAEHLRPFWEEPFASRADVLSYLKAGVLGATFYGREVAAGEFEDLQAFCVEVGLTYVLTYDGYGCWWGPARRIWRPGDTGQGVACALNADGGFACVTADNIRLLELADVEAILAYLGLFDDPHVPPLELGTSSLSGGQTDG